MFSLKPPVFLPSLVLLVKFCFCVTRLLSILQIQFDLDKHPQLQRQK